MGKLRSTSVENLKSRAARLGLKLSGRFLKIEDSQEIDAVATIDYKNGANLVVMLSTQCTTP
jgi:hypothetical protein